MKLRKPTQLSSLYRIIDTVSLIPSCRLELHLPFWKIPVTLVRRLHPLAGSCWGGLHCSAGAETGRRRKAGAGCRSATWRAELRQMAFWGFCCTQNSRTWLWLWHGRTGRIAPYYLISVLEASNFWGQEFEPSQNGKIPWEKRHQIPAGCGQKIFCQFLCWGDCRHSSLVAGKTVCN